MEIPCAYPVFIESSGTVKAGGLVPLTKFCQERLAKSDAGCQKHYASLKSETSGFHQCPYGFTTSPFVFRGKFAAITGVIATPRFGSSREMERAKHFPQSRVSRAGIEEARSFFTTVDQVVSQLEEEARKRLPQALHELRKLNAIVKQNAEIMSHDEPDSNEVKNVSGASELMSNIFEVLEALANVDGLKQIKVDQYIAVYDLAFKAKKIYQIRAKDKPIHIYVSGDREVGVFGSKKTFPIVLTVLIENAIKYGQPDTTIDIEVKREGSNCALEVRNRTTHRIDPARCFERGVRFSEGSDDGSGLGLYLAREVVLSHRGTISCDVREGIVVMRVVIPLAQERPR